MLSTQPDARLVALARDGNDGAFEEIVRRYRTALLRYSRSILTEGFEDAVQHAFLNAHQALSRGDDVVDLQPWLYRLTRNAAVDVRRRQGPETSRLDLQIDGVEQPHDALMKREALGELVTGVGRLPRRQREALVLREFEGRGHEEIAELLGVSGGAVRQLIHRARGTLRSAAAFLVPPWLVERMAGLGPAHHPARVAEIVTGGAGLGVVVAKGGAAVLATGALVIGGLDVSGVPAAGRDHAGAGVPMITSGGTLARPAPEPGSASMPRVAMTAEINDATSPASRSVVSTEMPPERARKAVSLERERRAGESVAEAPLSEPVDHSGSPKQNTVRPIVEADNPEEHPAEETEPVVSEAPDDGALSAAADPAVSDSAVRGDPSEAAVVEPLTDEQVDEPTD